MKRLILGSLVCAFALTSCSSVTLLRTKEMKAVGDDVKKDVQQVKQEVSASTDASKARIDSLEQVIDSLALVQKRMKVELSMLSSKIAEISDRNDSHHEELLYRLDLLLGKSDKILSKKVVVNGQTVEAPAVVRQFPQKKCRLWIPSSIRHVPIITRVKSSLPIQNSSKSMKSPSKDRLQAMLFTGWVSASRMRIRWIRRKLFLAAS